MKHLSTIGNYEVFRSGDNNLYVPKEHVQGGKITNNESLKFINDYV